MSKTEDETISLATTTVSDKHYKELIPIEINHIQTLKRFLVHAKLMLVCNNLEVNNTINLLYKALFMNWIFKQYFISLSIIEFMNHSEFMTGIVKLHNIEYTLKSH
jgi:hypothetical protein